MLKIRNVNVAVFLLIVGTVLTGDYTVGNASTFLKEDFAAHVIGTDANVAPRNGNNYLVTFVDIAEAGADAADLDAVMRKLIQPRALGGALPTATNSWFQLPRSNYNQMHQETLEVHTRNHHGPISAGTKILTNSRLSFNNAPGPIQIPSPVGYTLGNIAGRTVFPAPPQAGVGVLGVGGAGLASSGTVVTINPPVAVVGGPLATINHTPDDVADSLTTTMHDILAVNTPVRFTVEDILNDGDGATRLIKVNLDQPSLINVRRPLIYDPSLVPGAQAEAWKLNRSYRVPTIDPENARWENSERARFLKLYLPRRTNVAVATCIRELDELGIGVQANVQGANLAMLVNQIGEVEEMHRLVKSVAKLSIAARVTAAGGPNHVRAFCQIPGAIYFSNN